MFAVGHFEKAFSVCALANVFRFSFIYMLKPVKVAVAIKFWRLPHNKNHGTRSSGTVSKALPRIPENKSTQLGWF